MMEFPLGAFDVERLVLDVGLMLAAFVFALPVAWERQANHRPAGLRTFPIVALASCSFVLVGLSAFPDDAQAQSRVVQGLMTGIGFIGGGAILKDNSSGTVRGIATAASMWTVGVMGAATAYRRFELALVLGLANWLILRSFSPAIESEESAD